MTNPTPDLLPCPFCGGEAELFMSADANGTPYNHVECIGCGASVETTTAWNTRNPTPSPNAGAVKIKPLVWVKDAPYWKARSIDYSYCINVATDGLHFSVSKQVYVSEINNTWHRVGGGYPTIEAAKAAAQADYAARILACITQGDAPNTKSRSRPPMVAPSRDGGKQATSAPPLRPDPSVSSPARAGIPMAKRRHP